MSTGYTVKHLDAIEEITDGRCPWRPVRHDLGITSFGINAWTADAAGDRILNEHAEEEPGSDEELYFVVRGRATFELDGERRDAPAGTFVFVHPGVKRTAFAEEAGTTILALGGVPGKAYEPHGWELWAPLHPLYEAGEYAEVARRGREILASDPPYAELYYNVACCECLAGEADEAIRHLRRSIELSERSREIARRDPDFDAIRGEPAFAELVGS